MAMIFFYDPDHRHQRSNLDKDIVFIHSRDDLYRSIGQEKNVPQVVCICGPNKATIINEVQRYQQVKAIFWCDCSADEEGFTDSLFAPENKGGLTIEERSGWELTCRLTALEICIREKANDRVMPELEKLRAIQRIVLSRYRSLAENARLLPNQSNDFNAELPCREATD